MELEPGFPSPAELSCTVLELLPRENFVPRPSLTLSTREILEQELLLSPDKLLFSTGANFVKELLLWVGLVLSLKLEFAAIVAIISSKLDFEPFWYVVFPLESAEDLLLIDEHVELFLDTEGWLCMAKGGASKPESSFEDKGKSHSLSKLVKLRCANAAAACAAVAVSWLVLEDEAV